DAGTRCVSNSGLLNGYSSPVRPHDVGNTQNGREKSTMQAAEAIEKISEALMSRCTKLGDRRAVALHGLHLQHLRQPGRTGPRSGDFSVCPVTQPQSVKTVTIMNNAFDCLKVHYGMPSDLDERIAAQPSQEVRHGIISSKLFAHGMDPGAPFPSQHRYDLTTGEQPDLVAVHILDRQQLVGCTRKTHFFRVWASVPEIAGAGRRASFKWP